MSDDDASAYEVEEAVQRGLGPSEVQAAFNKATVWFLSESPALDEREDGSTHVDTG